MADSNPAMLSRDQILDLLKKEKIFLPGTWTKENLAPASYDLRIASDFVRIEDEKHGVGDDVYKIKLEQGQVALVSTKERFCLDWTLVGNMSPAFSNAKSGILVHTGSIVDPGFGLHRFDGRTWIPFEDERVHFFVTNLSPEPKTLWPGQKIATIQFNQIQAPEVSAEDKKTSSRAKVEGQFFTDSGEPLNHDLFGFVKQAVADSNRNLRTVEGKLHDISAKVETVEKGYQQLMFFGIYVLSAALLTIFGSLLLGNEVVHEISSNLPNWVYIVALLVTLVAVVSFPAAFTAQILWSGRRK